MKYLIKLDNNIIQISQNKNPIKMDTFKSFLKVKIEKQTNNLGVYNGWTQYKGDNNLIISGGVVHNVEYLDNLQYKKNLSNVYNNYVNPFCLFEILTEEGKKFFFEYYKNEINNNINKILKDIQYAEKKILELKNNYQDFMHELQVTQ